MQPQNPQASEEEIDFDALFGVGQVEDPKNEIADTSEFDSLFEGPDADYFPDELPIYVEPEEKTLTQKLAEIKDRAQMSLADTMSSFAGLTVAEDEIMEGVEGFGNAREIGGIEAGVQAVGGAAGALAEGLVTTGLEYVPDAAKDFVSSSAAALMTTQLGQNGLELAAQGGAAWNAFKKKHPETAKTIVAGLEIGTLALPAAKTGAKMVQKGKDQVTKRFSDMIAPVDKIAAGTGRAGKTTEEGWKRARTYNPSADDLDMAQRIEKVKGTSSNRTATFNQAKVDAEVGRLAQQLDADILKAGNTRFNKDQYMDDLGKMVEDFKNSDEALTVTGDAGAVSERILLRALDEIDATDGSARGLLQARRNLDKWLAENPGSAYDPSVINAKNAAMKFVRTRINNKVDELVPDVKVHDKLWDQHRLLRANDYLTDTMRAEGEDIFDRFMKKLSKGHVGPVGAATTAGFLGGMLGLSTFATVGGGALGGVTGYAAFRALNSATRRKVLGTMLKLPNMTKADKMILIDMLQQESQDGNAGPAE